MYNSTPRPSHQASLIRQFPVTAELMAQAIAEVVDRQGMATFRDLEVQIPSFEKSGSQRAISWCTDPNLTMWDGLSELAHDGLRLVTQLDDSITFLPCPVGNYRGEGLA